MVCLGMPSIESLLEETREAAYWVGLLLADGSVSEKRVTLRLNVKDRRLVQDFRKFIGARPITYERNRTIARAAKQDPVAVGALRDRFDIDTSKTYRPPEYLPYNSEELLRCFLVGFIDGDGSICKQSGGRRHAFVRIKLHTSWHPFQEALALAIQAPHTLDPDVDGYSELRFCDNPWLALLKRETADLPRLKRKWGRIDENYKPQRDRGRVAIARQMLLENKSYKEINQTTGMSFTQISNTRRRMGLPPRKRGAYV